MTCISSFVAQCRNVCSAPRFVVSSLLAHRYIKSDSTFRKIENREADLDAINALEESREGRWKKEEAERKPKVAAEWTESIDKDHGGKYWYNMGNGETTRRDPTDGKYALWKRKNLPCSHEDFMKEPSHMVFNNDGTVNSKYAAKIEEFYVGKLIGN